MNKLTFNDVIVKLLEVIGFRHSYPIKIIMGLKNSQYIDLQLFDGDNLDTILKSYIPDIHDLSIVWLDNKEQLNMQSFEHALFCPQMSRPNPNSFLFQPLCYFK